MLEYAPKLSAVIAALATLLPAATQAQDAAD